MYQRGVRCKHCKGSVIPDVSQSAEASGRVRAETPGRLCSSASRRRGEGGVQRAGGDRRCSKERGWVDSISEQGDGTRTRRERGVHNRAAEERYSMRRLPTGAPVRGTVCTRCVRGKDCAVRGLSQGIQVCGRVCSAASGSVCCSAKLPWSRGVRHLEERGSGDADQVDAGHAVQ